MKMRLARLAGATVVGAGLLIGSMAATPASARSLPKPKLQVRLQADEIASGADVVGSISLASKDHGATAPMGGVTLEMYLDGTDAGPLVTDVSGAAALDIPGVADGDHVLSVVYAGDAAHRAVTREHDFSVGASDDGD